MTTLKTGKHPARDDPRTLQFGKYLADRVIVNGQPLDTSGPPPTTNPGHASQMPTPRLMLANGPDPTVKNETIARFGVGCCVFAGSINKKRLEFAVSGKPLFPADGNTAIKNYEWTGYDPSKTDEQGNNPTDQGTDMLDWMSQWVKKGLADAKGKYHKIGAFSKIQFSSLNEFLWAIYLDDSGIMTGVLVGDTQQKEFPTKHPWSQGDRQDGHCILVDKRFYAETWADDKELTKGFVLGNNGQPANVDEAYFIVDAEGMVNGKSIEGFDSQQLLSDGKALAAA